MNNIINEYFIKPIINKTGYNPVNTITYGILLIIGTYLLYKLLKKLGYKINEEFLKANIPFILTVSVWHTLTDAGVYPYGFLTTTPGLYLPVISVFLPLIIISKKLESKGINYKTIYVNATIILLISQLILFIKTAIINGFNIKALLLVIFYTTISALIIELISKYWKPLKNKLNKYMMITQMLDASATHVSIHYYNYFEQHVVPRIIFNIAGGTYSFFLWKALILTIVIIVLDKDKNNKELNNLVRIMFITYGLATGVRDLLRLCLGV